MTIMQSGSSDYVSLKNLGQDYDDYLPTLTVNPQFSGTIDIENSYIHTITIHEHPDQASILLKLSNCHVGILKINSYDGKNHIVSYL
jgi:hypothetical protein